MVQVKNAVTSISFDAIALAAHEERVISCRVPCYNLADWTARKGGIVSPVARRLPLLVAGLAIIGGLSGCYWLGLLIPSGQAVQATPGYQACVWQWAAQDLSDVTQRLPAALDRAGIAYASVRAYTFGENCLNTQGEVQYFATMETDFDLALLVSNLADRESVGNRAADVLAILAHDFAPGATPGPQPGRITLIVSDGSDEARLTVLQGRAADGRGAGSARERAARRTSTLPRLRVWGHGVDPTLHPSPQAGRALSGFPLPLLAGKGG
jgi:hypothetical protein